MDFHLNWRGTASVCVRVCVRERDAASHVTGCVGSAGLTGKLTGLSDANEAAEGGLEIVVMQMEFIIILCVRLWGDMQQ